MDSLTDVRIDKWLWAVRVFKTRTLAADACKAGHVKIAGQTVKASHSVRLGEIISAQVGTMTRTVKVIALLGKRLGAKEVPAFMEDLTPPEEREKQSATRTQPMFVRLKGAGRPTKKERRDLNPFFSEAEPVE